MGVVTVLACLALTACGAEITVRNAAPGQEKTVINVPAGTVLNPARWPDACSFVTDAEIKAILPQAAKFSRESDWVKLSEEGALGGKAGAGLASDGKCDYSFELPQNGGYKGHIEGWGSFDVAILAVADSKLLTRYVAESKAAHQRRAVVLETDAKTFGADECYSHARSKNEIPTVVCRKGPLMFQSNGVGFNYIDFEGAEEDSAAFDEIVKERVTPAVFRAITANL
ncbi:hypothetical protein [Streptomyces sp. NPDC050164]|uniref:hypothetical protein n=1 Tax=Streptomyces sp. NPDC050164 TaxID=3365605 RepID=UPI0037A13A6C